MDTYAPSAVHSGGRSHDLVRQGAELVGEVLLRGVFVPASGCRQVGVEGCKLKKLTFCCFVLALWRGPSP